MWVVNPGKEEKANTYTYYRRVKEKSTSGGHYHRILLFSFCSKINIDQASFLFCVIKSYASNTVFFHIFPNARYNGIFIIGYLFDIVNPDPVEDYMNGVPIIVPNEQSILMLPMNCSPIPMHNDLEANKLKGFFIQHSKIQVGHILLPDTKCNGKLYYR